MLLRAIRCAWTRWTHKEETLWVWTRKFGRPGLARRKFETLSDQKLKVTQQRAKKMCYNAKSAGLECSKSLLNERRFSNLESKKILSNDLNKSKFGSKTNHGTISWLSVRIAPSKVNQKLIRLPIFERFHECCYFQDCKQTLFEKFVTLVAKVLAACKRRLSNRQVFTGKFEFRRQLWQSERVQSTDHSDHTERLGSD